MDRRMIATYRAKAVFGRRSLEKMHFSFLGTCYLSDELCKLFHVTLMTLSEKQPLA